MTTPKCKKFKGEIEQYLAKNSSNFDSRIKEVFSLLKIRTCLQRSNIVKHKGFHAAHVLFVLVMLPILQLKTVNTFCNKLWYSWSACKKDTFYRFLRNPNYRWRTFVYHVNQQLFSKIHFAKTTLKERYFIIDDTVLQKAGKKIENVSYIWDHSLGASVLGYCVTVLGAFTEHGVYVLDFAYRFSKKRPKKSVESGVANPKSACGQRVYEARAYNKMQLAESMVEGAVSKGFIPGYVLFDSWYAWPSFINAIQKIHSGINVICRLKEVKKSHTFYHYQGKAYALSQLYKKVKNQFKPDQKTGLLLARITVRLDGAINESVIVFSKGYKEPELNEIKGKKEEKEPKWVAFLSTDTSLHVASIIAKYTKRWSIEVCFKECKQSLSLGKDQSNDFNAQVAATSISFLRYNYLNYLNAIENYQTLGELFNGLVDDAAVTTYAHRLYDFFIGLFRVSISKIFQMFKLTDDFTSYIESLTAELSSIQAFQGCET